MRNIIVYTLSIIVLSAASVFAEISVEIDNWEIQQYKGRLGRWEFAESRDLLAYFAKKYRVTLKEIYEINARVSTGEYVFIPYSREHIAKLQSEGIKRNSIAQKSDDDMVWPVEGIDRITSTFGMRWGKFHDGVDLPKRQGSPVIAVTDGRVIAAGYHGGYGNTVIIEGRNHIRSQYSHNYALLVKKGEFVRKGQIIALLGSTGNSTGNHLHFEIRYKDLPLNPLDFLPHRANIEFVPFSKD